MRQCFVAAVFALSLTSAWSQEPNNFVYQIFVRSFADTPSDRHSAGELGDLRGILEKLDYLNDGRRGNGKDLEAGILWLMPIFPTHTYHGYDIEDYRAVNPEYGTLQDWKELVRAAHGRGMRIILDIAFNHTSNRHPWFQDAVSNPASRYRNFYLLKPVDQPAPSNRWRTTGKVRYLGLFGDDMPDLNFDEPAVRAEVKAIARYWLDLGADGFRLDAAKHIYDTSMGDLAESEILKNNDWWKEFSEYVYSVKPNAVLVGEVLGAPEVLRRHSYGLDALLDAPFLHSARAFLADPKPNFLATWLSWVESYRDVHAKAGTGRPFEPWVFLGSHDETPRLASFLQSETKYRLGMYLLFSVARFPVLYNGDELMQPGVKWKDDGSHVYDETLREPFPWYRSGVKAPQTSWFASRYDKPNDGISVQEQSGRGKMLDLVRGLSQIRAQHPDFANAEIDTVLNDSGDWLVFAKRKYLVLIRSEARGETYKFHDGWHPEWRNARLLFWSDGAAPRWETTGKRIHSDVFVPPFGFVLLQRS